jgi:glycosyltransferase involved in cell wall biosynthesis
MTWPRVTIAIATYNQAGHVRQAIASALAQDYPKLDVVVCDDASTDDTPAVVAEYLSDHRLRYAPSSGNAGRVANYRRALRDCARGEWMLMLDGDDYLLEAGYVRDAMGVIARSPNVVWAFAGVRMLGSDGRFKDILETKQTWACEDGLAYFLRWGVWLGPSHQTSLYPRALALDLDFYRRDIISSDWESLRRLALRGDIAIHGRPAAVWRRHAGGASTALDAAMRIADLESIEGPYREAMGMGFDRSRLDEWRLQTIVDYGANHVRACVIAGRRDLAEAFLALLDAHDHEAGRACRRRLRRSPHMAALFGLARVGDGRLAGWSSEVWRRITWRSPSGPS